MLVGQQNTVAAEAHLFGHDGARVKRPQLLVAHDQGGAAGLSVESDHTVAVEIEAA